MEPDGTKSPASRPNVSAARSWSLLSVGSSMNTSSPTTASAIARRMAGDGLVTVSDLKSIIVVGIDDILEREAGGHVKSIPFAQSVRCHQTEAEQRGTCPDARSDAFLELLLSKPLTFVVGGAHIEKYCRSEPRDVHW